VADQLLELLLELKVTSVRSSVHSHLKILQKTTPEAARAILNAQPQIAYALITLSERKVQLVNL